VKKRKKKEKARLKVPQRGGPQRHVGGGFGKRGGFWEGGGTLLQKKEGSTKERPLWQEGKKRNAGHKKKLKEKGKGQAQDKKKEGS